MKKILITIILVLLIILGIKFYPSMRLALETNSFINANGTYTMNCYYRADKDSDMKLLAEVTGNKADGNISGKFGDMNYDSFVLDTKNKRTYFDIVSIGLLTLEDMIESEKVTWMTEERIAEFRDELNEFQGIYISPEQILAIADDGNKEASKLSSVEDLIEELSSDNLKFEKVDDKKRFELEDKYLFQVKESQDWIDAYLAVDKKGHKGDSFDIICEIEEKIIKAEIAFTQEDEVAIMVPESILTDEMVHKLSKVYQVFAKFM